MNNKELYIIIEGQLTETTKIITDCLNHINATKFTDSNATRDLERLVKVQRELIYTLFDINPNTNRQCQN